MSGLVCKSGMSAINKKVMTCGIYAILFFMTIAVTYLIVDYGLSYVYSIDDPIGFVRTGSMEPELVIGSMILIDGNPEFSDLEIGDIIVFQKSSHPNMIVHRVVNIYDDGKIVDTKGDANLIKIPMIDVGITEDEYRGKIIYTNYELGIILDGFSSIVGIFTGVGGVRAP